MTEHYCCLTIKAKQSVVNCTSNKTKVLEKSKSKQAKVITYKLIKYVTISCYQTDNEHKQ